VSVSVPVLCGADGAGKGNRPSGLETAAALEFDQVRSETCESADEAWSGSTLASRPLLKRALVLLGCLAVYNLCIIYIRIFYINCLIIRFLKILNFLYLITLMNKNNKNRGNISG